MRYSRTLLLVLMGCGLTWAVRVGADAGQSALPYLDQPVGARAIALAGANTAWSDQAFTLFENPAGLALLERADLAFTHQTGLGETQDEVLALGLPLSRVFVLGFGVRYHGQPPIDNSVPGQEPLVVGDRIAQVSAGMTVARSVRVGLSVKGISSQLGVQTATALAADLGAQTRLSPLLTLGVLLQNFGTPLKYLDYAAPLPQGATLALNALTWSGRDHAFEFDASAHYLVPDAALRLAAGAEYTYARWGSLRLGYQYQADSLRGVSLGMGLRLPLAKLDLRLDYAFVPQWWLGTSASDVEHTFSLGAGF